MIRLVVLTVLLGVSLASCHILSGYEELRAREGSTATPCAMVADCPGVDNVCSRRECVDGGCTAILAAEGTRCLDSTCQDGTCSGYRGCAEQGDCTPDSMVCDLTVGLCVSCTQGLCDGAFPGTTCGAGTCNCDGDAVFCPGHGCVSPMLFDNDCAPCQIRCPGAGCVDAYGSAAHCGGCGVDCGFRECRRGDCTCDQALCDEFRPGTTCLDGTCECDDDLTWCPSYGCVTPLPFDEEFCAPCQMECGLSGCVDPYSSKEHCGGCDAECSTGTCVVGECQLVF